MRRTADGVLFCFSSECMIVDLLVNTCCKACNDQQRALRDQHPDESQLLVDLYYKCLAPFKTIEAFNERFTAHCTSAISRCTDISRVERQLCFTVSGTSNCGCPQKKS